MGDEELPQAFYDKKFSPWVITAPALSPKRGNYDEVLEWERTAVEIGCRLRVFVPMDLFLLKGPLVDAERAEFWGLIDRTPHLDWLLLTEHPDEIETLWPFGWYDDQMSWPNVWLGIVASNQAQANERCEWLWMVGSYPNLWVYFDCSGWSGGNISRLDLEECGVIEAAGPEWAGFNANAGWVVVQAKDANPDLASLAHIRDQCGLGNVPFWLGRFVDANGLYMLEGQYHRELPRFGDPDDEEVTEGDD